MPHHISRADYAGMFGPTAGDRIRLADTDLIVAVEHDFTVYGEEAKFGAGRMIRDGMGQSQASRAEAAADTVITNALIIDHWGIVKADIGLRDGRIAGIGKAGNPDIQPGVDIVVGPGTEVIAGEGRIVTAGAVDTHVPLVTPRQVEAALAAGITTMVGGGTGPATGSRATGCTPGPWHLDRMIRASEAFPMNLAFAGKGNASLPAALEEQVRAGAAALDLDADWGIGPAAIDCCLAIADEFDVQVSIRADARNESGFVEDTMAVLGGRTIRAVLAGGAPELARLLALANVLPASGQSSVGGPESIAAEDILHDTGAISMMASGGWAPGRAGDMLIRTWRAAHRMKLQRGSLPEDADGRSDNFRVKRYVAKYTINPAIAHGLDEWVGSVTIGKLADLVVWTPAFFGVKPELVIKMGSIAAAPADPSGEYRPMFGALGKATTHSAVTFVSQAAAADGLAEVLGMERRLLPVRHTRGITKESMIHNAAMPAIEIDPETGAIRVDGEALASAPTETLPMAQRYFLF